MVKLNTIKELVERLKDIRAVESIARDNYEQDVLTFKNFELTKRIDIIRKDEEKHISILDRLIGFLEGSLPGFRR
jgi:rubrerythrin